MDRGATIDRIAAILCADWSKNAGKRAVYVADVARSEVSRSSSGEESVEITRREGAAPAAAASTRRWCLPQSTGR